jgi:hypothetical protein
MAATYTLISSQVLGSTATSVTFSSIPQTYTDLKLVMSTRNTATASAEFGHINFNSDTGTNYSYTSVFGDGSTASTGSGTSLTYNSVPYLEGNATTANVFGSSEIYIPNYTSTTSKQILELNATEDNVSTNAFTRVGAVASLYQGTSAITSLVVAPQGNSFATNSSFYLYGLKSS